MAIPPTAPMTPEERVAAIGKIQDELNAALPDATVPWDQRDLGAEVMAAAVRLEALPGRRRSSWRSKLSPPTAATKS